MSKGNIPLFKVNLEFIHVGGNVGALCFGGQRGLLHAKHGGRKSCDAFHLKTPTSLETLPCGRNFDAHPLGVKFGRQRFEDVDDS